MKSSTSRQQTSKIHHSFHRFRPGFTIVELIIVIFVIGILSVITAISYNGIMQKTLAVSLQSDLKSASSQLQYDKTSNGKYPATIEAADDGKGLKSNSGSVFTYTHDDSDDSYTLIATNRGVSYYITSKNKVPTEGVPTVLAAKSMAIRFGGSKHEMPGGIVQTSDGGYVVVGKTNSYGAGGYDMTITKYDATGGLSWNKTWGGASDDSGSGVVVTSDGYYLVLGTTCSYGTACDAFLAKYNASGVLILSKTFGGSAAESSSAITKTSDGGYAVVGTTNNNDAFLSKFDSSLSLLWTKTWGGSGLDAGLDIAQINDGSYVVVGYTSSLSAGADDVLVIKYDSSTGSLIWAKTWGDIGEDYGYAIVPTSDGGFAITGETDSYSNSRADAFLAKYDSAGVVSWVKTIGGALNDYDNGSDLIQTSDGGYVITGELCEEDMLENILLAKYDLNGTLTWNKIFGGTTGSYYGNNIIQTSDGGFAIAGYVYNSGLSDIMLVKYNSDGTINNCTATFCNSSADPMIMSPSVTLIGRSATTASPTFTVVSQTVSDVTQSTTTTTVVTPSF